MDKSIGKNERKERKNTARKKETTNTFQETRTHRHSAHNLIKLKRCVDIQNIIMADVFELELHDIHEDDPNRAPDSDDDIIEVDEVIQIPLSFIKNLSTFIVWLLLLLFFFINH